MKTSFGKELSLRGGRPTDGPERSRPPIPPWPATVRFPRILFLWLPPTFPTQKARKDPSGEGERFLPDRRPRLGKDRKENGPEESQGKRYDREDLYGFSDSGIWSLYITLTRAPFFVSLLAYALLASRAHFGASALEASQRTILQTFGVSSPCHRSMLRFKLESDQMSYGIRTEILTKVFLLLDVL